MISATLRLEVGEAEDDQLRLFALLLAAKNLDANARMLLKKQPARSTPGPRPTMPCGTRAAYVRHRRHGEEACQPCKDAVNKYYQDRRKGVAS